MRKDNFMLKKEELEVGKLYGFSKTYLKTFGPGGRCVFYDQMWPGGWPHYFPLDVIFIYLGPIRVSQIQILVGDQILYAHAADENSFDLVKISG